MTRAFGIVLLLCGSAAAFAQPRMGTHHQSGMHHGGHGQVSMIRHHFVHEHGIGAELASKRNPLESTAENLAGGRQLYEQHCAACHGATGLGDGEAGAALNPAPANVAVASKLPIASDAYLYWTIAEGGVPVGSAMPPFKAALDENAIWQIILHLRSL